MAIQLESVGNGVLFNGALTDKQGWVLSTSSDQTKVVLTNRITGLSASSAVVEVEVDGSTFADYDALVAALGSVLFKNGGGAPSEGVQSVTGDGVDNTDPENPAISYPTPGDIGAVEASSLTDALPTGVGANGQVLKSNGTVVEWGPDNNTTYSAISQTNIENPASTASGLITGQRMRQGADAAIAASNKVGSAQESGVGVVISNIIQVTQAEYDGLTPQAGTFYAIVG